MSRPGLITNIRRHYWLFLLMLPGILYYIVFAYLPLYGIVVAFQDFSPVKGFAGSEFVGLKHFQNLLSSVLFLRVLRNTLIISLMKLVAGFPVPIILALMINELRSRVFKRTVQSISYLPNFISWVVISGMAYAVFNGTFGAVKSLFDLVGWQYTDISRDPDSFRWFLVLTSIWKSAGWSSILYLAAITNIEEELYEAAVIDGANKAQQIRYITMPGIAPTIAIVLILSVGAILSSDFEQIYLLSGENPAILAVADVLESYVFREGIRQNNFSFPAAVGIFQSVFGLILILGTNRLARKLGYAGIW